MPTHDLPTRLYTWLHISDLHGLQGSAGYHIDQASVLTTMVEDIARAFEPINGEPQPPPDLLVLSGDIAFSGKATEYKAVEQFLVAPLREQFREIQILPIPGNHDAVRTTRSLRPTEWALINECRDGRLPFDELGWRNTVQNHTTEASPQSDLNPRVVLERRFSEFREFANRVAPKLSTTHITEQYIHTIPITKTERQTRLSFHCWNTALLANGDDNGLLRVPLEWIANAESRPEGFGREVRILVTHHPLDWLANGMRIADRIRPHIDAHMHGHVHEPEFLAQRNSTGDAMITLTAGAAHDEEPPEELRSSSFSAKLEQHAYSIVTLEELADGSLQVRVRPRRWNGYRRRFMADQVLLNDNTNDASMLLGRHSSRLGATRMFEDGDGLRYVTNRIRNATSTVHCSTEASEISRNYRSAPEIQERFSNEVLAKVSETPEAYRAVYATPMPERRSARFEKLRALKGLVRTLDQQQLVGVMTFFVFDESEVVFVVNHVAVKAPPNDERAGSRGYFISIPNDQVAQSFLRKFEEIWKAAHAGVADAVSR